MNNEIGVLGMGVMGRSLALNIEHNGFSVSVFDREPAVLKEFAVVTSGKRVTVSASPEEFVASLKRPRKIILLVKAGGPVDWTIDLIKPFLESDDVLIDCGNSHFKDTERRQKSLQTAGVRLIGSGISGGEQGALFGPSLMPGGDAAAYELIKPIWEAVAAKTEDGPCVTYIGPAGAGHFVKMVHNGIEYGDMQLLAESYDIMRKVLGMSAPQIADVFDEWQRGDLQSYLIEITAKILRFIDPETNRPLVDVILDRAGQKGTGKWASEIALELDTVIPTIDAAVFARTMSANKDARVEASRIFPVARSAYSNDRKTVVDSLHDALLASRIVDYAQGFNLIRRASDEWSWSIELSEIARIWRGGCIIRASLLKTIMAAYHADSKLSTVLYAPEIKSALDRSEKGWRDTIALAQQRQIPVPAMSASLAYFDLFRTEKLPLNLTQAQRDFFGAHTYERIDKPEVGPIHTNWEKD